MMSMLRIENGFSTVELSPFQCATLAKACHYASEQCFDLDMEVCRSLAIFFHACTIAGYAQWQMSSPDLEALFRQLELLHLRSNHSDGNRSGLNGNTP